MKFWRPGITGKLFLAIFATCIVLLISMHWAVRISFERGFIDYIKRGNEQRLHAQRCAERAVCPARQLAFSAQ
jgi:two-component system sensor histidine kinase BaeS